MYENELRALLTNAGADLVGFSCLRDELPEELKKSEFAIFIVESDEELPGLKIDFQKVN